MTSREKTGLLSVAQKGPPRPLRERLFTIAWGGIQWPWLARSLWGGPLAAKHALLDRLGLRHDALPHLGSWKADTYFLTRIVDAIERLRPNSVVEIGCGATSLVIARALQLHGGGRLTSYDQHGEFVDKTARWLSDNGLAADILLAPIVDTPSDWSSQWYDLHDVPLSIGLLVIDGPHWALNPFVRGRAEVLFDRIPVGGMVLLDDAARPGERVVGRRWRKRWPQFDFRLLGGPAGTLVGERSA
ncbi:MAG: class I SAM-dependent methyltransferase [Croceibacterium sp.]